MFKLFAVTRDSDRIAVGYYIIIPVCMYSGFHLFDQPLLEVISF